MASTVTDDSVATALPREGMIDTAVRFLSNPNVVDRPLQQKLSFLKSKGLTEEEIRISLDRGNVQASISPHHPSQSAVIPIHGMPQFSVLPQPPSVWLRLRDFLHTVALLGGLGYAVYWCYKAYIEPFLFGRPKPKKSTDESLSSIEEAVSKLSRIAHERESGATRNLAAIKSDIATVKGLLLSRQQFPSAPTPSSVRISQNSKPSIPAWQMSPEQQNGLKDSNENGKDGDLSSPSLDEMDSLDAVKSKESNAVGVVEQNGAINTENFNSKAAVDNIMTDCNESHQRTVHD